MKKNKHKNSTHDFIEETKGFYQETRDLVKDIAKPQSFRIRLYEIIFNSKTRLGKFFDLVLILMIFISVMIVILHSIPSLKNKYNTLFLSLDWFFTVVFLIEYSLRIYAAKDRKEYIFSFWGIIDFLSIIPSAISLLIFGQQTIQVIRIVRFLRIFKVLRLVRFISEGYELVKILQKGLYKIAVFMSFIFVLVILLGAFMYVAEEGTPGFESIPSCIYYSIITITTVGFGDITPITPLGRFVSSIIMLAGYALIAVPTIIIGGEAVKERRNPTRKCNNCGNYNELPNKYCSNCGSPLHHISENSSSIE